MSNIIEAVLSNGSVLPLREYRSKAGNVCHGILASKATGERYFTKYGVNVSSKVVGDHTAIKSVKVLGKTFKVEQSTNEKEQTVLRASGSVKVASADKAFSLRITVSGEDRFNVGSSINGKRGGNGAPVMDEI